MSKRTLLALTVGAAGALLLGYCIYYDQKRRSDPNYKQKVRERRQKSNRYATPHSMIVEGDPNRRIANDPFELPDHEIVQHYFQNEIKMGEELFRQGKLDEGLIHLANATMLCAQPVALMEAMKVALPDRIYNMLMQKLPEVNTQTLFAQGIGVDVPLD
ncbi:mitochondrial import receptor subunit TOM20 homolog [Drosophila sulfurigaster albostrigata]|uniref:mitochondrial import receptor subunit TOM20 homolog n=1 Tax=Drosophila sulfurigaster albostrigata TaxID=89887 RepID=UPI002D21B54C|nr:mitochondrial import receptor subunit TOM20 homolog [Drosophila sulfurigaster albostrigata]